MNTSDYILFSGAAPGAEAEFGASAERHGIEEVNFTFDGHTEARRRGIRVLNHEELLNGDVSLEYETFGDPANDAVLLIKPFTTEQLEAAIGEALDRMRRDIHPELGPG